MLLATVVISATAANPACEQFKGGPADGMCRGAVIGYDAPFQIVALLPAPNKRPIDSKIGLVVSRLLASQRKETAFDRRLLATGATGSFCATFSKCANGTPLRTWPLRRAFVPNAPYMLTDGRIRIEWMRNGTLEYLSFLTFDARRVKEISTLPATIPVKVSN